MKRIQFFFTIIVATVLSCNTNENQKKQIGIDPENSVTGKWIRMGPTGPIGFNFKDNGLIETDFNNDDKIDVVTKYELSGDTIKFIDKEGKMCQTNGQYKMYLTEYYLSFDLLNDDCGGRIKTTMGFWTKPTFNDLIKELDYKISKSNSPKLHLNRARIFMAMGRVNKAREDFDTYLLTDSLDARVYVNRAATRFPNDLIGVVSDCNKAISIEPENKNAYFLRGLSRYELGEKELGCDDFTNAIELGFSVLRIAEQEKCAAYWDKEYMIN